jgi:hypothetical protein
LLALLGAHPIFHVSRVRVNVHELKSIIPQDHRIFCVEEIGITAVKHNKFVSTRDKQEVASLTSAERG